MKGEAPSFAVAVTCIDGRIQETVSRQLKADFGVDHLDVVTVPGADAALAGDELVRSFAARSVALSVEAHGSGVVIVTGHTDCAANAVGESTHIAQIRAATGWLCGRFPSLVVAGLLVDTASGSARIVADARACPEAPAAAALTLAESF